MLFGACKKLGVCSCGLCSDIPIPTDKQREAGEKGGLAYHPDPVQLCKRGHKFTPENIVVQSHGRKTCKICQREKNKISAARRKMRETYIAPVGKTPWDNATYGPRLSK